jgi:hypothetical protein
VAGGSRNSGQTGGEIRTERREAERSQNREIRIEKREAERSQNREEKINLGPAE